MLVLLSVQFIVMHNWIAVTLESVDEILKCDQIKATEQYFHVVLFIMLYKVVLGFDGVTRIRDFSGSAQLITSPHGI